MSWLTFLVGQGLLAMAWWWLSPGGFGPGHPRFWSNRVAPPLILVAVLVTLVALRRDHQRALRLLLAGWPAAWAGMAVALRFLFPVTMARFWLVPAGVAVAMGMLAVRSWRRGSIDGRWHCGLLAIVAGAATAGAALVAAWRPPSAATHPLDRPMAAGGPSDATPGQSPPGSIRFEGGVMLQTFDGSITARVDRLTVSIQPLLRFLSRSLDGAPTVLVRAGDRAGPEPRLRDGWKIGERSYMLAYDFPGQGTASLKADMEAGGAIVLEAASHLDQVVYSHLNAFCDVEVRGHRRLALEFSPCPGTLIEVRPFDYPVGRPARFAFVLSDRTFCVVEASSGEKGPFRTLARGRLEPEQALTITFHDGDRAIARLSLDDFAAQADTTLSPTAGWGVPVNAIEFSLADEGPSSPASIFVTLAGTSVGRGWDCVGHKAGTYRNRLRLESVAAASRRE